MPTNNRDGYDHVPSLGPEALLLADKPTTFCLDCRMVREMDKHGRCEICDSSAITNA